MTGANAPPQGEEGTVRPNVEAAQKVAKLVQIADIRLAWLKAARNRPAPEFHDWKTLGEGGFDAVASQIDTETKSFQVQVYFFLKADLGGSRAPGEPDGESQDSNEESDLEVTAVFELDYLLRTTDEFSESDLSSFALINGTFNAWSYWRELAQSMTARMGIPPLVVPLYRPRL